MSDNQIIHGLPATEYHQRPELSRSQLKVFMESPRRYYSLLNGWVPPLIASDKMNEGTIAHTLLIEKEKFEEQVTEIPETWLTEVPTTTKLPDGSTVPGVIRVEVPLFKSNGDVNKSGLKQKEAWRDFEEVHSHKITAKKQTLTKIRGMVEALDSFIAGLLPVPISSDEVLKEPTLIWSDEYGACRARPDLLFIQNNRAMCIDVKCTGVKTRRQWNRTAQDFGYIYQDVSYTEGIKGVLGVEDVRFIFVVITNPSSSREARKIVYHANYPHSIFAAEYSDDDKNEYLVRWYAARANLKEREESGDWSDPDEGIIHTIKQYWSE